MIKKVYIEEIKNETKVSKTSGKNYIICGIKIDSQWLNGFGSKITEGWQPGMTVEIDVYEEEYNGKMYKKFKLLKKEDLLEARISNLEKRLDAVAAWAKTLKQN